MKAMDWQSFGILSIMQDRVYERQFATSRDAAIFMIKPQGNPLIYLWEELRNP